MELILLWYGLFALTTAFAAVYELFIPVMNTIEKNDPTNVVIENKKTTHLVLFLIAIIIAPGVLLATVVPSFGDTFRNALIKGLQTD